MVDENKVNFLILESEILEKHSILQSSSAIGKGFEPLISYAGFKLYVNGIHMMPNITFPEGLEPLGSFSHRDYKYKDQYIRIKINYYLVFLKDMYSVWIDLKADEETIGPSSSACEILAFTNKVDIPKERLLDRDLENAFVQEVLLLHLKVLLLPYNSKAELAGWEIESELLELIVDLHFSKGIL